MLMSDLLLSMMDELLGYMPRRNERAESTLAMYLLRQMTNI